MRVTEPELKYCLQCDEEYRAEIENCATCGIPLIPGTEKIAMEQAQGSKLASRSMELSSDDELVSIRKGPLKDMKHLHTILASEKIPSLVAGEKGNCGAGCCGGGEFFLQIRMEDGEEATRLLAQDFKKNTSLDSHDLSNVHAVFDTGAEQSTCPACGFSFATTSSTCPDCGLCF